MKRHPVVKIALLAAAAAYLSWLGVLLANPSASSSYKLEDMRYFNRTLLLMKENYLDPSRFNPRDMLIKALDGVEKNTPEVMVTESPDGNSVNLVVNKASVTIPTTGVNTLWAMSLRVKEALTFVRSNLRKIDEKSLRNIEYAAINGMLSTLDPHSVFLKPEINQELKLSTKGEFGGLGITISVRDGQLTVISPIANTPAHRAGIRKKDRIVRIDEESTVNMPLETAVNKLRGPKGTPVTVYIMRDGWNEARAFNMVRDTIRVNSVISQRLEDGIGYLRIKNFDAKTTKDAGEHIRKMGAIKGLVLDLRDNPGGLLDAAIGVSDAFIDSGILVATVGHGARMREEKAAHSADTKTRAPIVVLVSAGSASASEIVSGALKNLDRAVVIGEQTFGKGSVQVIYPLEEERPKEGETESSVKLTIAQYLTPGDISIQSVGITPDIELRPVVLEEDYTQVFAEPVRNREEDLDRHLEDAVEKAGKPVEVIRYYEKPQKKEEEDTTGTEDDFREDFEINLARRILLKAGKSTRSAMLEAASGVIGDARNIELRKIFDELGKRGISWDIAPVAKGKPVAAVSLEFVDEAPPITAGDKIEMVVKVANKGDAPFHQLRAVSDCDNGIFSRHELLFGKIAPGEARESRVKIKAPKRMDTRTDQLLLHFYEGNGFAPPDLIQQVMVRGAPEPSFAVTYKLDDKEGGDGDGLPEAGETVRINLQVDNEGAGKAEEVIATLRNETGPAIFVDKGRETIGKMDAPATAAAFFTVKINQKPEGGKFSLRIAVFDATLAIQSSQFIEVPLGKPLAGVFRPAKIKFDEAISGEIQQGDKIKLKASIEGDGVLDVYVLANDDKVFYKALDTGAGGGFQIETEAPLKAGANGMSIVARKDGELVTYRSFVVSRPKSEWSLLKEEKALAASNKPAPAKTGAQGQ
ncbi:MAG: hypothetical protein GMKNLPBB_00204 [Myxococcota bacterium]|nr:hypothetical protein [Myxococcota bacterium]